MNKLMSCLTISYTVGAKKHRQALIESETKNQKVLN